MNRKHREITETVSNGFLLTSIQSDEDAFKYFQFTLNTLNLIFIFY